MTNGTFTFTIQIFDDYVLPCDVLNVTSAGSSIMPARITRRKISRFFHDLGLHRAEGSEFLSRDSSVSLDGVAP